MPVKMVVVTKEEAMKLTVVKLKEELGTRGLSQDGLKVWFATFVGVNLAG